jgi:hypothetical protein
LKQQKAQDAAEAFLRAKYSLSAPKEVHKGNTTNFPIIKTQLSSDWEMAVRRVCSSIQTSYSIDQATCENCADLAMFVTAFDRYQSESYSTLYESVSKLAGTETYKSLLEMGRGRGGEYALQLIKTEISHLS